MTSRKKSSAVSGPRFVVRHSKIHGNGVFALVDIRKGERIIEYKGKRRTWVDASADYPEAPKGEPEHTFLFSLDDDMVIDGNIDGNSARWINHSCAPNCEAVDDKGRIFIEAIRHIRPGQELNYDYNLQFEERYTAAVKKRFPCWCGNKTCRGTLLGPKERK